MKKIIFFFFGVLFVVNILYSQNNIGNKNFPKIPARDINITPTPNQLNAWLAFNRGTGDAWEIRWNSKTGSVSSLFGSPLKTQLGIPENVARDFLQNHSSLLSPSGGLQGLELLEIQERQYTHVVFQQKFNGIPVCGGMLSVHLTKDNKVYLVNGEYYSDIHLSSLIPSVGESQSIEIAKRDLGNDFSFENKSTTKLLVLPYGNDFKLVWHVIINTLQPAMQWAYFVSADDGTILGGGEMTNYFVSGDGNVYDRHPEAGSPVNRILTNLDSPGSSLSGKYVYVLNIAGPVAFEPDASFVFEPSNTHFDEVMVYYHANRFQDIYLTSLGYPWLNYPNTLQKAALAVHSDRTGSNWNSNYIHFWDGNGTTFNDAAKEDVIIYHEYTHLVIEHITASGLHQIEPFEKSALAEAFSDYFAGSYANTTLMGEYYEIPGPGRNLENNFKMSDWNNPPFLNNAWKRSQIFSGALWDIREALSQAVADAVIFEGLDNLDQSDPSFLNARDAIVAADNVLYGGSHSITIQQIFAGRGIGNSPTVWSGEVVIVNDITILTGTTLNINAGTSVKFANSKSITVNGHLTANGTSSNRITFTRNGTSGNWGSIIFDGNASSNSVLNYVEIKYASQVECKNDANATIMNSLIDHCTHGIYIYNSAPLITDNQILDPYGNGIYGEANGKAPLIQGNKIKKLTNNLYNYQGIYLGNYTNPFITGNDIQGFYYGIYYGGGGTSWFSDADYITPETNNRLVNNNTGLCTAWGSYTIAGWHDEGSHNSIYGNTYLDAKAYQYGQIEARFNWWGSDGPQISAYQGGLINAANVLDYDPWEGIPLRSGDPPMVVSDDIFTGILLEKAGRIDETIKHYKQMISRNYAPGFALARLAAIKNKYAVNSIQNYLESLLTVNTGYKLIVLDLLAGIYLGDNNYNQAMQIYNKIIDEYPNSYGSVNAKFEKFFATLNYAKNITIASNILSEIQSLKLTEEEQLMRLEIAEYLLKGVSNSLRSFGKATNPEQENNELSLVKEYSLFQNYPNPFNPRTQIKYSLKEDAFVTLKLYDILGNEIAILVHEPKSQGIHTVDLDAANLSSGVYIYQLKANNYIASKKMIITK